MNPTKNDLPLETREKVGALLNEHLAALTDLYSHAKQAHWNVKGPNFYQLHLLFDAVAEAVEEFVDEVAERCVQLGGQAKGTVADAAKGTCLPPYPSEAKSGKDHVTAMATSLSTYAAKARAAIDESSQLKDADTADLFTEISRAIDKQLWFVEAHLQEG